MKLTHLTTAAALTLAAAVPAQIYHSSPVGHLTTEGKSAATLFGGVPDARYMFMDGELRNQVGAIKEVAYRVDSRAQSSLATGLGRAWTNVTLDLSNCDLTKFSQTFSKNPTSTPTRVFSGSLAWPTLNGFPPSTPATWGARGGGLSVPLSGAYVYVGTTDLCLDYKFSGGTLANKTPWSSTFRRTYYLDGYSTPPSVADGSNTQYGKSLQAGGCVMAGTSHGWGGHAKLGLRTYSLSSTTNPGKILVDITTLATAANNPVVQVLGLGGSAAGVSFPGVTCNKLHLDLSKPNLLFTKTAAGAFGISSYNLLFTYTSAAANVPLWLQAAWTDPGTGGLMLTDGSLNAIPKIPTARLRKSIHATFSSATVGLAAPSGASDENPVCRYAL